MDIETLRERVCAAFGPDLAGATPERIREFLDRMYLELAPHIPGAPLELAEGAQDYDEVMRGFFVRALHDARDPAFVLLWITAFELWAALRFGTEDNSEYPDPLG